MMKKIDATFNKFIPRRRIQPMLINAAIFFQFFDKTDLKFVDRTFVFVVCSTEYFVCSFHISFLKSSKRLPFSFNFLTIEQFLIEFRGYLKGCATVRKSRKFVV